MSKKIVVYCINSDTVYESIAAAAAAAGVDKSVMSKHVNGKAKTAGGYVYVKIDAETSIEERHKIRAEKIRQMCSDDYGILIF